MSTARVSVADFKRQRKGSMASHQELQRAVLDWFRLHGIPAVPVHTGPRVIPLPGGQGFRLLANASQRGFSDVMACLPPHGRLGMVELKTGKAKRSAEQVEMQRRFARAGAITLVVYDIAGLEAAIRAHLVMERCPRITQLQGGKP